MAAAAADEISMNDKLFQRVKYLYDRRDQLGLDGPQKRAIELSYKSFTRNGALLSADEKEKLKNINKRSDPPLSPVQPQSACIDKQLRTSCG